MEGMMTRMMIMMMVMIMTKFLQNQVYADEDIVESALSRLYKDKITNYNKNARPVIDHKRPTVVLLSLSVNNIDVDDEKHEFILDTWTFMKWHDEHLKWTPTEYMNIDRIHFDNQDVWLPDITVYNSVESSTASPFNSVPVLVESDGQVYWFPPTHLRVKCDLNLTEWPRDEHNCFVRMGSWAHHGEQINIEIPPFNNSAVIIDNMKENSRWKLLKASGKRIFTNLEGHEPYVEVDFTFKVQRQASTEGLYLTQSTFAVVMVVLVSYLLPLHRLLLRVLMHLFSLGMLIICFFTLFIVLPPSGGPLPFVVRYFSGTLVLTILSLLATLGVSGRVCCCCFASSCKVISRFMTFVTSHIRRDVISQANSSEINYNNMNTDSFEEEDEDVVERRPQASQLNQGGRGGDYVRLDEVTSTTGGGERNEAEKRLTHHQFFKLLNYLVMFLFALAFAVDYVVLRKAVV